MQFVFLGFALCSCSLFVNVVLVFYLRGFLLVCCYRLCSLFLIRGSWFRVGWFFCVFVRKYCSCYVVVVRVLCS